MNQILEINNLTKRYYNKTALDDVSVSFQKGKIYGLMGPNGSGKTTLMKVIIGLHKQTSGSVLINGVPLSYKTKASVSYMPTENYLYDSFKVKDIVKFYQDMYTDFRTDYATKILSDIGVDLEFRVSKLSSGLVGKLKVALALSRDVDIYMLDEPLNGVDVLARDVILELIVNSYNENKVIILSSHLVSEVEKTLDHVVFLKNGKLELSGDAEDLRLQRGLSIENIYKEVYK
ncbi:ABC-2 type transport system ATP-binding protein [Sedimentibacter acidaminivorans]|uniref:ABC-2 type transport system ATP-binding protein n=1 Tax=Sedimentibacter acidaminivorans TaxID=913099 RepID=A0ABS4GFK3_9FIRM|nr:ABC transporter ATP-binding protein [Sedimentibacter acidaminivorans]MBP1926459.1 ABC-2 type transport system ATP-binding protein [Sedimentibacter acidaminivorans]